MTKIEIRWAATHDWFIKDNGDGTITVADRYADGTEKIIVWKKSLKALRNWAGY